jgi:hypothetical protein
MRKSIEAGGAGGPTREPTSDVGSHAQPRLSMEAGGREIIIPHDPSAGPVTAVRNVVVQSSLTHLKANGYYDRYVTLIAPHVLEQLSSSVGPSWIPIALVLAHYEACENLMLSADELNKAASQTGDRLQETALVSPAKRARPADFDLWTGIAALHRMWGRLYQGGSVQFVKLGPKEQMVEVRGFPQNQFSYYRKGQLTVIATSYAALGAQITSIKLASYSPKSGEVAIRISWA